MGLAHAIAEEQAQLKAVMSDIRLQKNRVAERPSGQMEKGEGKASPADSSKSSSDVRRPGSNEQQIPESVLGDELANFRTAHQPVNPASMEFTDIPASIAKPYTASPQDIAIAAPGSVSADVSAPVQAAAITVRFTTGVSEHVEDVDAPGHFTDGSEVTAASARSVTMQDEEAITMEAPDPHSIFASETLTSRHLADTQARPTSTQHPPKEVSQGEGVPHSLFASDALARMRLAEARGVPTSTQDRPETSSQGVMGQPSVPSPGGGIAASVVAVTFAADDISSSTESATSGLLTMEFPQPMQTAKDAQGPQHDLSHERRARKSADLMSRVDEQVLAAAGLDPELLTGPKLSNTIGALLGTEEYDPSAAQGGTGLGAGSSLAPSASAVPEESASRYFSLAQIRARLADLSSQDTEQSVDAAVVRAWLQANKPKQEPALAVAGTPPQQAAAVSAGGVQAATPDASTPTEEAVGETLAKAMTHAEQCLRLITSAQEMPELKALEALEIAKELRASLTEMSRTEISPQEGLNLKPFKGRARPATKLPMERLIAGMSRLGAPLLIAGTLVVAWKLLEEYQRSAHWPPPA